MQGLAILGATGSIGASTLDVALRHPERFRIVALTAHRQVDRLFELCLSARPKVAVLSEERDAFALQSRLRNANCATEVRWGREALCAVASLPEVDAVMAAIVGAAGLEPTLAAVRAGKKVLLANKEALVMAGGLFMAEVAASGSILLPIDSEHNAVFQSLPSTYARGLHKSGVRKVLLTASGGPFRTAPLEALRNVTPEEACAHPKWVMGRKISVDSATMMNKGLEVIEAHWLFSAPADRIEVVIHPQSIIHSMVSYVDGSVIAQLGNPDMRTPIAHALAYPERIDSGVAPLDLCAVGPLVFEQPDLERFPCLALAFRVLALGGTAPATLNAANEVAVAAFLEHKLPFLSIATLIAEVLELEPLGAATTLEEILEADRSARQRAEALIKRWTAA